MSCRDITMGSIFLSVRVRRETVELWAHQASLGLLVNLAVKVLQGPQAPHLQVRLDQLHLIYIVAFPTMSSRRATRRCQQSSALYLLLKTIRVSFAYLPNFSLDFVLTLWRTHRGSKERVNDIGDVIYTFSEKGT